MISKEINITEKFKILGAKYDDTDIYRAVSRRNPPKKWAQAIAENSEHDIFIPEGRGVVYLRDRL